MLFSVAVQSANPPVKSSGGFTLGKGIIALWLLLWSLATIALDVAVLVAVSQTMLTWNYPVAKGTISQSELRRNAGETGDKVVTEVKYLFQVGDRKIAGSRVSFFDVVRIRPRAAEQLIKSLPVGKSVDVYFSPAEPSNCALDRSLGGRPLFLGLLLMPLNLVMVAGWRFAVRTQCGIHNSMIQPDGNRWIARRLHGSPLAVALIVAGAINLVAIILLSPSDAADNLGAMSIVWGALIGIPAIAYWKTSAAVRKDLPIFIADNDSRTLIWPLTAEDGSEQTTPAAQIRRVDIVEQSSPKPDRASDLSYLLSVTYVTDEGQITTQRVFETANDSDAEELASFLDDWTGLGQFREEPDSIDK